MKKLICKILGHKPIRDGEFAMICARCKQGVFMQIIRKEDSERIEIWI